MTLFGAWFLYQALKTRRQALELSAARAETPKSSDEAPRTDVASQTSKDETELTEPELTEQELFEAARYRRNRQLQSVATGCAPLAAVGVFLLSLGVAAIAFAATGPGKLSFIDALSIPFFTGALLTRTFYRSVLINASKPEMPDDNAD